MNVDRNLAVTLAGGLMNAPTPRWFQTDLETRIQAAWDGGARNVIGVLPTGGGKTFVFSKILQEHNGPSLAIAHRQELVGQISLALARNGVRHRLIAPHGVVSECCRASIRETRRNYIDPTARCVVAGVDTLIRIDPRTPWLHAVTLWVIDEAHHLLAGNKWGRAVSMLPAARGLGVTATPCRADGRGLGRHADGVMDALIVGPGMRELIREGWLSEYRIFAPETPGLDLSKVTIGANGDYSPDPLRKAVHASHIVGDAVQHYLRIAPGKLGITFSVDVEAATEQAAAYRAAGIPAEVVSAKTPDYDRREILRRLRAREILQVCNVDLFGEGFDLPAIEVVSMTRPTESYALFAQQFGRGLRIMDGKTYAIIIDHVGNTMRHGLPDAPRVWTLDRRERRSRGSTGVSPVRVCIGCAGVYDRALRACPYCGTVWTPADRSAPEFVDGDLAELSPEVLARLRGEIDKPLVLPYHAPPEVIGAVKKHHREKQEAQADLRAAMATWGGRHTQRTDAEAVSEMQRRFWLTFGTDVLTAQTLGRRDAAELMERIRTT